MLIRSRQFFSMLWLPAGAVLLLCQNLHAQPDEVRVQDLGSRGIVFRDSAPGQFSPLSSPIGDVNGDGFADLGLFWGPYWGSISFTNLFVVYGGRDLPEFVDVNNVSEFSSRFRWTYREEENYINGPRTVPAGDVDGDGFDDFFLCDPLSRLSPPEFANVAVPPDMKYRPGVVFLIYGSAGTFPETDLMNPGPEMRLARFSSTRPNRIELGRDVANGGDFNGDGRPDFVFAAPFAQADSARSGADLGPGRIYILFARSEPPASLFDLEEIGVSLDGMIVEGDEPDQSFGAEVAFVGDTNGDGFDDLLIGVASRPRRYVLLLYGAEGSSGIFSAEDIISSGRGVQFWRQAGVSPEKRNIAALGDVNDDGLADFAIGAPGESSGLGAAYVVFGREDFDGAVDLARDGGVHRLAGSGVPDRSSFIERGLGQSLTVLDYNSDGRADLFVGSAREYVDGVPRVGAVFGLEVPTQPGQSSVNDIRSGQLAGVLLTTELPEWFGASMHAMGDMNGDGVDDILVAAPYTYGSGPNRFGVGVTPDPSLYVVYGSGGLPPLMRLDEACPPVAATEGGTEITLIGRGFRSDVEILVEGQAAQVLLVESSVQLVFEAPPGVEGDADITIIRGEERLSKRGLLRYEEYTYENFDFTEILETGRGMAVDAGSGQATVLDFDGDGFGDIVVESSDGAIMIFGRSSTPDLSRFVEVVPSSIPPEGTARLRFSDREGYAPYGVGDVNGDDVDDLVIVSDGVVTVLFGGERWAGSIEAAALLETGRAVLISFSGTRRPSASGGGDVDGDGLGDFLLYRPSFNRSSGVESGEVNIVRGRRDWPALRSLAVDPVIRSFEGENTFGASASLLGDIDGDGSSELVIGAPGLFWSDRGNAFLISGGSDLQVEAVENLVESGRSIAIDSVKGKDSLGISSTELGDFNGDGVPDLAIGALAGWIEFAGESYVIFGDPELDLSVDLAEMGDEGLLIQGQYAYDLAVDLAAAGDFNGDGLQDLLVSGGSVTDAANPFPARSFVVFGGTRGIVNLGELGASGFSIEGGQETSSIGGTDFNGDGFSDIIMRSDSFIYVVFGYGPAARFIRGDSNASGTVDLSDAIRVLSYLFLGAAALPCDDAADSDDSGRLDITDAVFLLTHLFLGGAPPPSPFPDAGRDPTEDNLSCRSAVR